MLLPADIEVRNNSPMQSFRLLQRATFALAIGVAGAGLAFGPSVAAQGPPAIVVTHTERSGDPGCLRDVSAAKISGRIKAKTFEVVIDTSTPFCAPISAAVYDMPSNPLMQWPQELADSTAILIKPGVTVISFARRCSPTQFDVFSGRPLPVLSPTLGLVHGALLSEWTAFQDRNFACTTTTPPTSVVVPDALVPPAPTTVAPTQVPASVATTSPVVTTTTPRPRTTPTTEATETQVGGVAIEQPSGPESGAPTAAPSPSGPSLPVGSPPTSPNPSPRVRPMLLPQVTLATSAQPMPGPSTSAAMIILALVVLLGGRIVPAKRGRRFLGEPSPDGEVLPDLSGSVEGPTPGLVT